MSSEWRLVVEDDARPGYAYRDAHLFHNGGKVGWTCVRSTRSAKRWAKRFIQQSARTIGTQTFIYEGKWVQR